MPQGGTWKRDLGTLDEVIQTLKSCLKINKIKTGSEPVYRRVPEWMMGNSN